jgi:hypothetical protein
MGSDVNISELQRRIGDVEQRVARSGQASSDYLRQLQERLAVVQDRLVRRNAEVESKQQEIDHLTHENTELRTLLDRLIGVIEREADSGVDGELKDLDIQVDALVELAGDASGPAVSVAPSASAAQVSADIATPAKPGETLDDSDRDWMKDVMRRVNSLSNEVADGAPSQRPTSKTDAA